MSRVLSVNHLTKRFGSTTAVEEINFSIEPGQALGLLGPNGAGKTTTMRLLQGALRPTSGSISIFGHAPLSVPNINRHVGFAFDASGLPTSQTVSSHLTAYRFANGLTRREIGDLIDRFDLSRLLRRRIKQLSTGERKRVSLATAMACRPHLLVLDEPTNGLDVESCHWLRQILLQHVASGGSLLISSHILSEVEQVVDSIVTIKRTQLFHGSLNELRSHGGPTLEDAYLSLVSTTTNTTRFAA